MNKLSFKEKAGYASGDFAGNLIWQTLMFFLPSFYSDTFGLPLAAAGTLFLVVRIFDAVNDPLMGKIQALPVVDGITLCNCWCIDVLYSRFLC